MNLTERQQEVLDYISHMQATVGVMPSTREIQEHFGFASQTAAVNHLRALEKKGMIQEHFGFASQTAAVNHLRALEKKGMIHRQPGKARAVAVISQLRRERIVDVPVYGSIAAGFAEAAEQHDEGTISIDAATLGLGRSKGVFALKVRGDSMIGAGINDGDLAILEKREPRAGAIVAALIDGETTLKRLVHQRGRSFLRAENPNYPDLVPLAELSVQGVMVALIRKYRN